MLDRMEEVAEKLKLSEIPEKPWTHLMVDFIMKLPVVMKGISAERLARLFRDNMWKLHRLPESIVSNRGPQFAVKLTK